MTMHDIVSAVDHPAHYRTASGIEAIDVIETWGFGASMHLGSALKYLLRAGRKGSAAVDLAKAEWYVRRWRDRVAFRTPDRWPRVASPGEGRRTADEIVAAFSVTGRHELALRALLRVPLVAESGWAVRSGAVDALEAAMRAAVDDAGGVPS